MNISRLQNIFVNTSLFKNNQYLKKYCEIVSKNASLDEYIEYHHVFPCCLSKFLGTSINNNKENLVKLSFKNHIKVHCLLALSCKNKELFYKMYQCVIKLIFNKNVSGRPKTKQEILKILSNINEYNLVKIKKYKSHLSFYKKCNEFKTFNDCCRFFHQSKGTLQSKYDRICKRYNLKSNFSQIYTDEENISFYKNVNSFDSIRQYALKNNIKYRPVAKRYERICKKYNLFNKFVRVYSKTEDKAFYNKVKTLGSGAEYARINKISPFAVYNRLRRICKRYNWPNPLTVTIVTKKIPNFKKI